MIDALLAAGAVIDAEVNIGGKINVEVECSVTIVIGLSIWKLTAGIKIIKASYVEEEQNVFSWLTLP